MQIALVVLLLLHGALHLLGFGKAFGLAALPQLKKPISRTVGIVWLASAVLLFATAGFRIARSPAWWVVAIPAIALSQTVIATSWRDAKFGTIANAIILVPLALALLDLRSSSFRSIYARDVAHALARPSAVGNLTEKDLASLPPLVQTYVRRTGALGRPRVRDVRSRWHAQMKRTPDSPWMEASADQHDFFDEPARVFLMEASQYGLPFLALHRYLGESATMQVRVASILDVVDARGPEMNQSETVTPFNDICLLAPRALIDAKVSWASIDAHSVDGAFRNGGHTIHAVLVFDEQGDLVDFVSNDRFLSADGKKYERFPWSTPLRDYREFDGRRVASRGDAAWKQPLGDFVYGRFELIDVEFNVGAPARK